MPTSVAIFVPPVRDWSRLRDLCIDWCRHRGYEVKLVMAGAGADFEQVTRLRDDGVVDKVIVADPRHVPPTLPDWVEAAGTTPIG